MLILSRKVDQSIMIGEDIVITVIEIDHGKVRLGVAAPREIPVHRKEIYESIKVNGPNPKADVQVGRKKEVENAENHKTDPGPESRQV